MTRCILPSYQKKESRSSVLLKHFGSKKNHVKYQEKNFEPCLKDMALLYLADTQAYIILA